jgi:hypothetical protein
MNSGVEAVETAIKFARKWGYEVKKIHLNHARIIWASNNFHGRTTLVIGASDEYERHHGFGPYGMDRREDFKGRLLDIDYEPVPLWDEWHHDFSKVYETGNGNFIVPFGNLEALEK